MRSQPSDRRFRDGLSGWRRCRRRSPRACGPRSTSSATPPRGGLAIAGAIGFWAANIGILWASFHAFDVEVPLGVVVQGFFVGMVANLIPFVPGGVGAVDAGLIGTFVLFGYPGSEVFAAVLVYRLIAFWLPIPPGIVAFFQLRRTVARWEEERAKHGRGQRPRRVAAGPGHPGAELHYFRK